MREELNKAAEEYYFSPAVSWDDNEERIKAAFLAGAEWMAKQGVTVDGNVEVAGKFRWIDLDDSTLMEQLMSFKNGDNVIVQIRKK